MKNKPALEALDRALEALREPPAGEFVPTGLQDKIIMRVGTAAHDHYHVQSFNNLGKTTLWINLVRQICFPTANKYFQYPLFQKWPYRKSIAVVTTKENLKEAGTVEKEIKRWWPKNLQDGGTNEGQHFKSLFRWKSGFTVKLFSNEQPPNQFEGPEFGLWIMDEPGKPGMVSAFNTRLKNGGFGITIFTPVTLAGGFNPGPIIDILEDLQANGRKICWIPFTDINENHIKTGTPNRFKEKRGLYTTEQIRKFISGVSSAEMDARVKGSCNIRSGRVYRDFSKDVHCGRDYDLLSAYAKTWNNYMVMDPHRAYYPFMNWYGITEEEDVIIWNEWPTYKTELNNQFYDQIRTRLQCHYTPSDLAEIIKILDSGSIGMTPVLKRFIDPRFAKGTTNEWTRDTMGIIEEFNKVGIRFDMPPYETIDKQRTVIMDLLKWDRSKWPLGGAPRLWVLPHCVNTIRAFERHYYVDDGSETESEDYKDPPDCLRYFLAGIGAIVYRQPVVVIPSKRNKSLDVPASAAKNSYLEGMKDISQ